MSLKNVYAALPAYRDGFGNGIELITENGRVWTDQCFATVKKHWAESYGRVWQLAIRESEDILEQFHLHVVLLSEACCIIPVKVRKPLFKDDGAYGYVCDEQIAELIEVENGTNIIMKNGEEILSYTHLDTIGKYRRQVRLLRNEHKLRKQEGKIKKIIFYE